MSSSAISLQPQEYESGEIMIDVDDSKPDLDAATLDIEIHLNWDKILLPENKKKLLTHIEKWREGEQYHAFILVSIKQRNLFDIVSFFHENKRELNTHLVRVYESLIDQLLLLSK